MLSIYRVRARNTSADSENKIHDNTVAATYGFRGGLVPGITVYAYMTVPVVQRFGLPWLERGAMNVRFLQPFYDGEEVIVRSETDATLHPFHLSLSAAREDGTVCATAVATLADEAEENEVPLPDRYPQASLPQPEQRLVPSAETLERGAVLGSLTQTLSVPDRAVLESMDERLPIFAGELAVAHPFQLLRLSNEILMSNYKLGPWIHASSDLKNWSTVRDGEALSVRGLIADRFERKGHEFVVLDVAVFAGDTRVVQQVRHTAIYMPRR